MEEQNLTQPAPESAPPAMGLPALPDDVIWPPTEDELPYDDGAETESDRHALQIQLLKETLTLHWDKRDDFFAGGNMFVYFSLAQVKHQDFRGPDFFVVRGVERRERKSWVVWQEGKGPDVVIELLSESTADADKGEKKQIYQDRLKVAEYFWYDPFGDDWAGFGLRQGRYEPLALDARGRFISRELGLALVRWEGTYTGLPAQWLRFETLEGELLPTGAEMAVKAAEMAMKAAEQARQAEENARQAEENARQAQQQAQQAKEQAQRAEQRAQQAELSAQQERERTAELERLLADYRARLGEQTE
jgi:Uma2 family endonuclease